ncbi:TPA: PorV/PorQ family protein [Candidatus Poribacteria bacterium]|nr:PorV/PorQ family protein [Candidatus Poribacteria bacterium]
MICGKVRWTIIGAMLILLTFYSLSMAADTDIVNAASYLKLGVGARFLAMGGASTAAVDDATAVAWNVAGLTRVKSASVASMYSAGDQTMDRRHNFLALAGSVKGLGSFGIGWINAGVVDIPRYNDQDVNQGTFNSNENAFLFSYGASFKPVRLGAGVKVLHQKIDPDSTETKMGFGGLDIGALADPVEAVTVGLSVQNILGKIADAKVPTVLRVGTAVKLLPGNDLMVAVDLSKAFVNLRGKTAALHIGAEYWAADLIGFRLGFSSEKQFAAGIGVKMSNVSVDYAYTVQRDGLEPDVHYVSICASF